nr:hypothetical protein [Secundilactobacillus silagei]
MLSYFALITLVKLSGLLIPFIWFLWISNRRWRSWGIIAIVALFIVSYINTYFNLPDLAYPSLIDGWLMWLIGGFVVVLVLRRFVFNPNAVKERAVNEDNFFSRLLRNFGITIGWLGRLVGAAVLAIVILMVLSGTASVITSMNPKPAVNSIKTDINNSTDGAPMPVIKNSAETPVVNAPQTVSTDMNNSLNSFKNSNVYDLNHMRVQMYNGKMVYVAPVEFSGGFGGIFTTKKYPVIS